MTKIFIILCIVASFNLNQVIGVSSKNSNRSDKFVISRAPVDLGDLLLDYDKHFRPGYGNHPVTVNISLYIADGNWKQGVLNLHLIVREFWTDKRLSFVSQNGHHIGIDDESTNKIWYPDTYLPTAISIDKLHQGMVRLYPNGTVLRSQPYNLKIPCEMNLNFVVKNNGLRNCTLRVDSYGHTTNDVQYKWHGANAVKVGSQVENVRLVNITQKVKHVSTGSYSDLVATLEVKTGITKEVVNFLLNKNGLL